MTNQSMLPLRGSVTEAVFALASMLISILIAAPSRPYVAGATNLLIETKPHPGTLVSVIETESKLERHLFELASPFDFINDQCGLACNFQEEQEEDSVKGPLINACPKVS